MNRIDSYEDLAEQIVNWIKDYYWDNDLGGLVVGVSGGIDSAVVSTLCARTGLPTYILTMPLDSNKDNTELSDAHAEFLKSKYPNVVHYNIDLSENRAKSVKNALLQRGIPSDRIQTKGYGMSVPLNTNSSGQERALNRRTELKIIAVE